MRDTVLSHHKLAMINGDDSVKEKTDEVSEQTDKPYQTVVTPVWVFPKLPENGRKRKLILHLDVRNTVLVADSITNVSVEQALNSFLSGVVWGRDLEDGTWEWMWDEPSLKPPCRDSKTYYRHLEKETVKTPKDRDLLRKKTGDFVHSDLGAKFLSHFKRHLECLKWNYPTNEDHYRRLTMHGTDGTPYHYILPSVYKLIYTLVEDRREFSVVIRTYGLDCENVLHSLNYGLSGKHPQFRRDARLKVNLIPGTIKRTTGEITLETVKSGKGDVMTRLNQERDIYSHLSNSTGISGYKDDFQIWQDSDYHHSVAKPLWIDPNDRHVHHIFFDDNFRSYEEDSIVDMRMFDHEDRTKARSLSREELQKFEDVCLVQADLLESLENDDYFIEKVAKCENLYSKYLRNGEI